MLALSGSAGAGLQCEAAGAGEKRLLRPSGRVQTCCQVHAHWCTVGAVLCRLDSRPEPRSSPLEDSVPGHKGPEPFRKGELYGKPGSLDALRGHWRPQNLPLVKDHTISQKYTEDSDGACAHQNTRRQTDGQRRTAQHRVDKQKLTPGSAFPATAGGAGARSFPPLRGGALGAALCARPAPLPPGR